MTAIIPPAATYTLIHYGFAGDDLVPELSLQPADATAFTPFQPLGHSFTLTFDTAQRYCTGWHELATSRSLPCPDSAQLPEKYQQCRHCMNKTGFNPAFYNAATVSPQQQARNAEPHLLYLAHFGPGVVKVGISWAGRGIRRLLEQGARSAVIIKTYPNADIARQYEAKIAALDGIAETLQPRKKQALLQQAYDPAMGAQELQAARERVILQTGVTPGNNEVLHLDSHYLRGALRPTDLIPTTDNTVSGTCIGLLGSHLMVSQEDQQFALPLAKLLGYRCQLRYEISAPVSQSPRQVSLFGI